MKKKLLAGIVAAMLSTFALAQTASITGTGMGLLQNEWVKAGVNTNTGTLGSGGGTSPGLLFDPTGTGTFNPSFDYLTPGSPFDGFSLKVDGTNKTNNNAFGLDIAKTSGLTLSNSNTTLSWSGAASYSGNSWAITNSYTLAPSKPYIDITSTIVAGGSASNVYFAKFIDPDSQGMAGDSSATDNVLGYGAIPSTNVAFSEATVSRYALGLYSAASNVRAGITGWSSQADAYINANASCGTGILFCRRDDTIGLTFHWTGVNSGDTLTASYAYIFGPSAFGAASSAITGGAGGGTPGTVPGGGTLTDVGSATSAASASSTPTVTGTTTVNGTPTWADTNGDSVVISTSLVAGNYLTRNYNSLTTTEVGRVTTTPRTIVTTWSSGPSTSAATTPLTASETYYNSVDVTDVDIATGSAAIGSAVWVSNGIDNASLVNARSAPVSTNNGKILTVATSGVITANELYTVTTPTRFTYDRTTTTVTTNDFAPTSTYSDTSSTVVTSSTVTGDYDVVTNDSIGRTASYAVSVGLRSDQIATAGQIQGIINRDIEFGKTLTYKYYSHNIDGYTGHTNLFGVGHNKDLSADTNLGFGINSINTNLAGNASSVRAEGIQFGATIKKKDVKGIDLSSTVQHTFNNYNASATPSVAITTSGDSRLLATQSFNTSLPNVTGKTSGNDTSITLRAIRSEGIVRPIVGGTYGKRTANGYTANMNVLPGVTVSNQVNNMNKDYGYATVGAMVKYGIFNATALHHTDGVNQYGAGLTKEKGNLTFNVRADRFENTLGGTNVYAAGLTYKF